MMRTIAHPLPYLFSTILFLSLTACSPLSLINSTVNDDNFILSHDIPYGDHPTQKLDVYQPAQPCKDCPVLIWVHGGAWQSGNKELYTFIGDAFSSVGMVVVIPDYRKYPNLFPDFLNDTADALSWVHTNIEQYGGNSGQLNLLGHSSGAHIIMMLAYDQQYLNRAQVPIAVIQKIMGLAGPYDFLPLKAPVIKEIFSTARPLETSQPIYYASNAAPPALLMMGLEDKRVDPQNSTRMAAAIQAEGGQARVIAYPKLGHSRILLSLSHPFRNSSSVYPDILAFLRQTNE